MPETSLYLVLISVLFGFLLGIITGLTPGLHVNNVALLLVAFSPVLLEHGFAPLYIAIIIVANAIAHTFLDFIPSIFLGAPEADTALAVLPGHQLLLEGKGVEAIRLSAIGSAGSVIVALLLVLPLGILFQNVYGIISQHMGWILLFIVIIMIWTERGEMVEDSFTGAHFRYKGCAVLIFLLSGLLGLLSFTKGFLMAPIIVFGEPSVLFPLFSGLFGASMLLISLLTQTEVPDQIRTEFKLSKEKIVRGVFTGSLAGSLVSWLPGVSSAVATVIARLAIREDHEEDSTREFIVAVSGVNTANAIFSLVALYVIQRARSGAMVAVNSTLPAGWDLSIVVLFLTVIVGVSIASYFITILIGDHASQALSHLNYPRLCAMVLIGLGTMAILFTGLFGMAIFAVATLIGALPSYLKVKKTHAMGVLLFPLILYFFGLFVW
ncbi:MAG: tripartite tricarboxylate transporter permease [Methanocellales archaeon]|nr:tripartite tricarboxylate transporter permease [Methanocellales archaeon]